LGVAALAAACVSGCSAGPHARGLAATQPPGSADRVCVPSACVSLSRLAHSINTQLKGNVTGYVALIGKSRVFASGLARAAADPPQLAMGPDVMVNVASVGKMFTTIAVLQSLAGTISASTAGSRRSCPRIGSRAREWAPSPSVNC